MHHPVRRRILILLMFSGHLGLVSLTSTVILTMASTETSVGALYQLLSMVVAIALICALAMSEKLDRIMCDWVGRLFLHLEWIAILRYEILFETPDGFQLAEHTITDQKQIPTNLRAVSLNGNQITGNTAPSLSHGDRITVFGLSQAHQQWTLNA